MAIRYLKTGKPQNERSEDDAKVRAVVEAALADIEARGDSAVRELAEKFDNFSPESYRLSQDEIDELISEVSPRRHGRHPFRPGPGSQVRRNPARLHAGCRGRDNAGGHPRSPQHSGAVGRVLRACRQVPHGGIGAYVGADRLGGGCATHCCHHTAVRGATQRRRRCRDASWRCA